MDEPAHQPKVPILIIHIALAALEEQSTKWEYNEVEKGDVVKCVKAVAESSKIEG